MRKPWRSSTTAETQRPAYDSPTRPKADSRSARGNISGPTPIPGPMDDELPLQGVSVTDNGSVGPPALAGEPNSIKSESRGATPNHHQLHTAPPNVLQRRVQLVQDLHDDGSRLDATPISAGAPRAGHKRNQSYNVRASTYSIGSTSGSRDEPQQKKSMLRGAIGRLFGRKKRTPSQASTWATASTRPTPDVSAQHPGDMNPPPGNGVQDFEPRHSVSLPPSEYGKALRSHSVGPEDRLAIESARNSLPVGSNFSRRHPGTQSFRTGHIKTGEPSGLTPRPASINGGVTGHESHEENPNDIGRAITKDFSRLKRRSQSLSALAIMAKTLQSEPRRLSGEIRYWRDSYETQNTSSIYSHHPDAEDQECAAEENNTILEPPPIPTVQRFDFPNVSSMGELSGMKITEAATLESRIRTLEQKTENLERAMGVLGDDTHNIGDTPSALLQPQGSNHSRYSGDSLPSSSPHGRGGDGPENGKPSGYHGSRGRDTSKSPSGSGDNSVFDTPPASISQSRPLSTATIRAAASLPLLSQDTSRLLTMDHYTTLIALVETERSARLALEDKVKLLSHQISVMAKSAEKAREATGLGSSAPSFSSVFDYDDDDDENSPRTRVQRRMRTGKSAQNRQVRTGAGDTRNVAALGSSDHDDSYSSTSYTTTHGDETDDDIGAGRKRTGRALSLSQMTMKKPQP